MNVAKGPRKFRSDIYHELLSFSHGQFFLLLIGVYSVLNLFFATAYFLCGPHALAGFDAQTAAERFTACFFFSVQTFATIGYGHIYPQSAAANLLMTVEAFVGLMCVALATGLFFARFSKPTARVVFSDQALLTTRNGVRCLVFRMANARHNQIVDAQVSVTLAKNVVTQEGEAYRKLFDLPLERHRSPSFALSWIVIHPIDATSPLQGATHQSLRDTETEIVVSLIGLDETYGQTIHARFSYSADEILCSGRFADMVSRNPDGKIRVDLEKMNVILS